MVERDDVVEGRGRALPAVRTHLAFDQVLPTSRFGVQDHRPVVTGSLDVLTITTPQALAGPAALSDHADHRVPDAALARRHPAGVALHAEHAHDIEIVTVLAQVQLLGARDVPLGRAVSATTASRAVPLPRLRQRSGFVAQAAHSPVAGELRHARIAQVV
jgi:hypothetical protein